MVTITIKAISIECASDACREVAEMIDDGYVSGEDGMAVDSWTIKK